MTVAGIDPATAQDARPYTVVAGRFLQASDGNAMLISENLARQAGLGVGDVFRLPSASGSLEMRVVGILSVLALPGVEEVYVPLPAAQALFDLPGQINTIEAIFAPGVDHASVEADLSSRLGPAFRLGALEWAAN